MTIIELLKSLPQRLQDNSFFIHLGCEFFLYFEITTKKRKRNIFPIQHSPSSSSSYCSIQFKVLFLNCIQITELLYDHTVIGGGYTKQHLV